MRKNKNKKYSILLSILFLFACGAAEKPDSGLANSLQSVEGGSLPDPSTLTELKDARYYRNIKYGPHHLQAIDLWIPASDKPVPLVLYIHGGGFRMGDKAWTDFNLLHHYLDGGMAYASVNYRLIPEVTFPDTHLDCARAIQFLRHHAQDLNLDSSQFASTGGSAGAGISLWLAFKDDLADPLSDDPIARQSTRLSCVAAQDGQSTYDPFVIRDLGIPRIEEDGFFFPFYGIDREAFDTPEARKLYREASAASHLTEDDVPVLMNYSDRYPNIPVTEKTPIYLRLHHPRFGLFLMEKMEDLNLECIVQYSGFPEGDHLTEFDFIFKHMKRR